VGPLSLGALATLLIALELIARTGAIPAPHAALSTQAGVLAVLAALGGGLLALGRGATRGGAAQALRRLAWPVVGVLVVKSAAALTAALHPTTCDGAAFRVGAALGMDPSWAIARLMAATPALGWLMAAAREASPLALGAGFAALATRGSGAQRRLIEELLWACGVAFVVQQACPVAGPSCLFAGVFPSQQPPFQLAPLLPGVLPFSPRSGLPSLPVAVAMLLVGNTWVLGLRARLLAGGWLALACVAELGSGSSYVVALALAVPLSVAARGAAASSRGDGARRAAALAAGVGTLAVWVVLLRSDATWLSIAPLGAALLLVTVCGPLALDARRVGVAAQEADPPGAPAAAAVPIASASVGRALPALFFCSGVAGLVYEVVFAKSLALTFGSTAQASGVVLATYMGGMALGSWAGGRVAAGRHDAARVYALCEAGIAGWCAASPLLFTAVRSGYVALAPALPAGHPGLVALQVALGAAVILPATFLMGVTLPVLTRGLLAARADVGWAVGVLYGANTLGAAAGALLAGYVLLPALGLSRSTWLAVGLNAAVACMGLALGAARQGSPAAGRGAVRPGTAQEAAAARVAHSPTGGAPPPGHERALGLAVLAVGGAVTLSLEVTYTHLLAVVAGNSTYAFSMMLFAFLIGLGVGAAAVRRWLAGERATASTLATIELGLGATILAGVFLWEAIPGYFGSFGHYPPAATFGGREFVRFVACFVAMAPPAFFIGAAFPAALECASRGHPAGEATAVGRASALNTAGNIVGAVAASFVLLPSIGSLRSLHVLAAASVALGCAALLGRRPGTGELALAGLVAVIALAQPAGFDLGRLASGSNVYFREQLSEKVIDHAESVAGGLTTVTLTHDGRGADVHTLYTNGKFQGNDSPATQMKAQYGFGLVPLLHTAARSSSLVIGFGVGGTTRALHDAGFASTDVVELSDDVITLAARHFSRVGAGVLGDPGVHVHIGDGRNFLLLSRASYDVISIEVTSIWFAGAASLYSRDFYEIARGRLAPGGVLQQWVQLHHISRLDLVSIVATLRSVFPSVWLYVTGGQGLLVACPGDCAASPTTIGALDAAPLLHEVLALYRGSAAALLGDRVLDPQGVDRLVAAWGAQRPSSPLVSTDDNMRLEYSTPRGNMLLGAESLRENTAFLRGQATP
jgi:predicted membrane-bound spermidine synthase